MIVEVDLNEMLGFWRQSVEDIAVMVAKTIEANHHNVTVYLDYRVEGIGKETEDHEALVRRTMAYLRDRLWDLGCTVYYDPENFVVLDAQ